MDKPIDQPLAGNPEDLGVFRRPTVAEMGAEILEGVPRYNYWLHSLLTGDDGQFYPLYLEFLLRDAPPRKDNGGKYQLEICRASGALVDSPGHEQTSFGHLVFNERYGIQRSADRVTLFSPASTDLDSPPNEYVKFELEETRSFLSLKKTLDGNLVELHLAFDSPDIPFWYNKGRPATIFPDGTLIFGVEDVLCANGYGLFNGRKVQLAGLGEREHFFNRGDIVQGILKYRNECWVILYSDEVRGVLVQFNDYRDGKLVVEGKHLLPIDFKVRTLELSRNNRPIRLGIEATTLEGVLEVTLDAIMICAFTGNEFPSKLSGAFTYKDGREVPISNGLAWREEII